EEALAGEIGPFTERLRELALRLRVPGVRHVDQLCDLLLDGGDDARRAVAEQAAAPARKEVEVSVTFRVPDVRALAAHQADGVARVVADDVLLVLVDDALGAGKGRGHEMPRSVYNTISVPTPRSV